ncbi:TetR/AcrR family transcriptional regulator [Pelagibacterium halotolerans]|uniref:TetR/AcrR family transcriptional regulator n=1 Tax=Pelagibacterium halotolerans TaxID=531813 RepID=UPI00385045BF
MRTRLSKSQRRSDILEKARQLILARGLSNTEMEDIRLACRISRGGLYHHFANKRAVVAGLVEEEVEALVKVLETTHGSPFAALLRAGSSHLGKAKGVLSGLSTDDERLDYLSSLDQALAAHLSEPLRIRLKEAVLPNVDPGHVAELFLTINAHINRREILGQWRPAQAAGFAATALQMLVPMLRTPSDLEPIIADLKKQSESS